MLILRFCVHTFLIQDNLKKERQYHFNGNTIAVLETFKLIQHATSGKNKIRLQKTWQPVQNYL